MGVSNSNTYIPGNIVVILYLMTICLKTYDSCCSPVTRITSCCVTYCFSFLDADHQQIVPANEVWRVHKNNISFLIRMWIRSSRGHIFLGCRQVSKTLFIQIRNLRVHDLQISCSGLTQRYGTMVIVLIMATMVTCPIMCHTTT